MVVELRRRWRPGAALLVEAVGVGGLFLFHVLVPALVERNAWPNARSAAILAVLAHMLAIVGTDLVIPGVHLNPWFTIADRWMGVGANAGGGGRDAVMWEKLAAQVGVALVAQPVLQRLAPAHLVPDVRDLWPAIAPHNSFATGTLLGFVRAASHEALLTWLMLLVCSAGQFFPSDARHAWYARIWIACCIRILIYCALPGQASAFNPLVTLPRDVYDTPSLDGVLLFYVAPLGGIFAAVLMWPACRRATKSGVHPHDEP